ncbi:MAG: bifunctional UDP-sugar hydrolase/5'-nucleotidase [Clostridium sp.]|nr:bifunctional UDP-sugar hydrolase/5'-nucleotidase [Clostridium sp.]
MCKGLIKIVILETSDVHGSILPIDYSNNEKTQNGMSILSTIIKRERKNNENVILIDNGDVLEGTPFTYYYAKFSKGKQNPIIDVLNYLKYDAVVIGNHEFNYGMALLKTSMETSKFPWLSANILDKKTAKPAFGKPYIIKKLRGIKIGILGLTTKYIPNWENPDIIKDLNFEDAVVEAQKWVDILKNKEKADIVIVSYHGGFERNIDTGKQEEELTGENEGYEICSKVKGIDVLLTGHQHRYIENKSINGVTVIQPGSNAKALGKVEIDLTNCSGEVKIINKKSKLIYIKNETSDIKVEQIVDDMEKETQKWLDKSIGKIKGDMEIHDCLKTRTKDNAMIEFVNKVQMESSGAKISNTALFDNNSKGFKNEVTMRDVVLNYIYPNTLKVIRIKGSDIRKALEKSASFFEMYNGNNIKINTEFTDPKPQYYNYDMWEGIEYEINISRPFGKRITKLNYKGKPIENGKNYDVVMNNYRAGGGGNFSMFKNKPIVKDIPIDMSELIADYIIKRGTIEASVNNNWRIVHD